jgi:hypothetical protein
MDVSVDLDLILMGGEELGIKPRPVGASKGITIDAEPAERGQGCIPVIDGMS